MYSAVSLCTPEHSAIQKLAIIIIVVVVIIIIIVIIITSTLHQATQRLLKPCQI